MDAKLEIVIDDRERASGLAQALCGGKRLNVRVARLALGDVQVAGRFLIERKTVADLVASLLDGRLADQMRRLKAECPTHAQTVVILEGELNATALAGLSAEVLRKTLLEIQVAWRHVLVRTRNVADTALTIEALAELAELGGAPLAPLPFDTGSAKKISGAPARSRSKSPVRGAEALQLAALQKIPGLGARKAKMLLAEFGSIAKMTGASVESIAAVSGIGEDLARVIRDHLRKN